MTEQNTPNTPEETRPHSLMRLNKPARWALGVLGALVVLLLFVALAVPAIVQSQLPKFIKNKSGHVLTLGKPSINPLAWTVEVPNLALAKADGEELLKFDRLAVNVAGLYLLKGTINVESLTLDGLRVNAALLPDGRLNFSDLIDAFADPEPKPDSEPPNFRLGHLAVSNASIGLQDKRTEKGFNTRFEPLNVELHNLATKANAAGELELQANTSFDATVALKAAVNLAGPAVKGQLDISGVNLGKLKDALQPLLPVSPPEGTAALATAFDVRMAEGKPLITLNGLTMGLDDFAVKASANGPALAFKTLRVQPTVVDLSAQQVSVAGVELAGLQALYAQGGQALQLNNVKLGEVKVDLAAQDVQAQGLNLSGLNTALNRDEKGQLNLLAWVDGFVQAANSQPKPKAAEGGDKPAQEAPAKPWTYTVERVALDGSSLQFTDATLPKGFAVGISNLTVATGPLTQDLNKPLPVNASLTLDSGGTVKADAQVTPASAAVQATVELKNLALKVAQPFVKQYTKLDLVNGELSTAGKVNIDSKTTQYTGNLLLQNLRLNETGTKTPFLQMGSLSAPQFTASPQAVRISRLNLKGLDTALLIARDKSTNISRILVEQPGSTNEPAKNAAPTKGSAAPAFAFAIDRFTIADSKLKFADESLFIPFGTNIKDLSGVMTGLSSLPGSRGELEMNGQIDDYGQALAQGQLDLFNPLAFLDIRVKFQNVEMNNLTPYSATFANRKIKSGKLNLDLDYRINNRALQSNNKVTIDKLVLGERVESPQAVDLPLDLAIAILQDSNGRIDLGIPVTGSLDDPQFSYGAVVWKAFTNVLTKIVTAPFRALGSLFGGSEEALGSATFEAGAPTLSPPERENLKKLAEALAGRPTLGITVNGVYTPADKVALQSQQLRKAVAAQAGEKLDPNEDPGPLALQSPKVQKALEDLAGKKLADGELATLKNAFRQANPGQLPPTLAEQAMGGLGKLFKEPRQPSPAEVAALKGKNFYAVLADRLRDAETVTNAQLLALARSRQDLAYGLLKNSGLTEPRLQAGKPTQVEAGERNTATLKMDLAPFKP
ncbi:MAG: DUF748 domain-containing protein [Limnobacter sp.]|uniref:DUF748 domain-containing protein n=2 Tax=Pseudomonadota TaxID=1224 RepID=UPI00391C89F1